VNLFALKSSKATDEISLLTENDVLINTVETENNP
jgi:hypothetical protein